MLQRHANVNERRVSMSAGAALFLRTRIDDVFLPGLRDKWRGFFSENITTDFTTIIWYMLHINMDSYYEEI